jgi:hypothetical protein
MARWIDSGDPPSANVIMRVGLRLIGKLKAKR